MKIILMAILLLCDGLSASVPMPPEKPKILMTRAVAIATERVASKVDLDNYYLQRVELREDDQKSPRRWIVTWCPDPGIKFEHNGWCVVEIGMDGKILKEGGYPSTKTKGK